MYLAFAEDEPLTTERLVAEMADTVPLSRMRPQDVSELRQWGKSHARPASPVD